MNILVLGNGFDLAHGLKTSYKNFLASVEITDDLIEYDKTLRVKRWEAYDKSKIPQCLCEELNKIVKTRNHEMDELRTFHTYWRHNFWFKYFKDKPEGTWIDFERDIKEVCKNIEDVIYNDGKIRKLDEKIDVNKEFSVYLKYLKNKDEIDSFAKLINVLEEDLKHVINSLDIYINEFINNQECEEISPDIISLDIDKVISFNYSFTYLNLYNVTPNIECDYIHGKAGLQRNRDYSNLVLGYDESKEKIKEEMLATFAPFKKYYQRVLKGTGNKYVKWVDEIQKKPEQEHCVYFFGHSMDITDQDVIKALVLNNNVKTTVYFFNNQDKMAKIKNLISVLGYDDFIEYTRNRRIEFINQTRFDKKKYSQIYKSKMAVKNLYNLPYVSEWTYKSINEWFDNLDAYSSSYDIKYLYLAIDALQKFNVETNKVLKLIKICSEHWGKPCSYQEFLKDYSIYCGVDTKFENNELEILINDIYKKRVENETNGYYKFLERIKFDGRTLNSISMGTTYLIIDLRKLTKVADCFLDAFDKYLSYPQIYDDMVSLLDLVDPDLVEELFASMLNESSLADFRRTRMNILLSRHNAQCNAKKMDNKEVVKK
ncbi:Bacteriophage abortive infection AbiH [Anaerosporobacter mobilis DSM 15930]|uniref:Bacteriophage abortive infection AbiH n=1 Tax=Anaerosporobacter mobilis DSM 15930 TaxID=1120996 RepID=A0A1M7NBI9_9FIRM|nr:AbiH family protein [Anaerosporobacter mobilis]SHN00559.1 Bacteriophage abortive infection AbiH [Anaerosporobacter mobilis DSM 15930]